MTQPWTSDQDERLALRRAGLEYREIGAVIGRSGKACIHRARVLELPRRERQEHVKAAPLPHDVFDALPAQPPLPIVDEADAVDRRFALPAGHPRTWGLLTRGTCLEGAPYQCD